MTVNIKMSCPHQLSFNTQQDVIKDLSLGASFSSILADLLQSFQIFPPNYYCHESWAIVSVPVAVSKMYHELLQLMHFSQHKKQGYNSVNLTDNELKIAVVVAESSQTQTSTDHTMSVFKTFARTMTGGCAFLQGMLLLMVSVFPWQKKRVQICCEVWLCR